ncbi:MAG: leucine-rich repeat domain-containing protein [Clostridia bacterium]|nr:leucine-rich repeat domain-containing protein [Clostridia bacterium]
MMAFISKRRISRIIRAASFIMALILCALMMPFVSSAAESGTCGENLTWTYDGGTLTISGTGEMTNFYDNNMPPWYEHAGEITSAIVEEGVTSLGELAFYECDSLTNVVLPSTLTEIGIRAFKDCTSLAYLNIPTSLYAIGESAFENCSLLNGIRLSEGVVIISDKAFFRCSSLSSITIPSTVNFLGMVVFGYCHSLLRVDIRCPIEKLPDGAFYDCEMLYDVGLPDTLVSVGSRSFHNCINLNTVYYTGDNSDGIFDELIEDDNGFTPGNGNLVETDMPSSSGLAFESATGTGREEGDPSGSNPSSDKNTGTTEYSYVTETDNSIITVKEVIDYEIKIEEETSEDGGITEKAVVDSRVTERTVDATIDNEDGWGELSDTLDEILNTITKSEKDDVGITVNVQLTNDEISGEWINEYSGKDVTVNITTNSGDSWQVKMKDVDKVVDNASINLSYTLTDVEKIDDIKSDTVKKLTFTDDVDFNTRVNLKLGITNSRRYATLYQRDGKEYKAIQSVIVDGRGRAWFSVANIDKGTDYYIAFDVEGVNSTNAVVPPTMYEEYGGLIDENGVRYQITGRTSKWGITGGQFALYVGIALGFMILVVAVVMITRNHFQKVKLTEEERRREAEGKIDKEALYDEVLRDMLKEGKDGEQGGKEEAPKKK